MNQDYLTAEYKENQRQRALARSHKKHPYGYRIERKLGENKGAALRRGKEWTITDEEARRCFISDCYYCGRVPEWDLRTLPKGRKIKSNGIDRVDNNLGYIPGNCVPCCYECNVTKRMMTLSELMSWVKTVYERFDLANQTTILR